jgi:bacterioferritin|tara:strand:+ start:326 stop:751 length:426 start_codon:yes stop_codon:yes gene_type:complete
MNSKKIIESLNEIYKIELAGVIRYTHYALMIVGPNRIPLVAWMREQAKESLMHADMAGEHITGLDGHPSIETANVVETNKHSVVEILNEALEHEKLAVDGYYNLLELVKDKSVYLEEYARGMIGTEEIHLTEVKKMLRDQN